jgi:hypothetical protein
MISVPGLLKHESCPHLAFSADGILHTNLNGKQNMALIEYKAPALERHSPTHPYAKHENCIPKYYYDQMQGSMYLLKNYNMMAGVELTHGWFIVWQPHVYRVQKIPYDEKYATKLINKMTAFYYDKFLPSCFEAIKRKRENESS